MRLLNIFLLVIALSTRCTPHGGKRAPVAADSAFSHLKYAHGFRVRYAANCKWVDILRPFQGAAAGYSYLLVPRGAPIPPHNSGTTVIPIPLKSIVCTSTTHIPLLDYLGETDKLTGFPTTDYVSSEKMRRRIDAGKVVDLGMDKGLNLEVLATLRPTMVMGYQMNSSLGQLKKIQELGIPVVVNAEYLEEHPLGRAEWIKFMALFFDRETEADSVFSGIESEYLRTQALVRAVHTRPTVMSGIVYGDTWFLPGGKNYAARLLQDAGSQYLWKTDSTNGFLELSFESVYEKAKNADLWIGVGSFKSLSEIRASDVRYTKFKAYERGSVFTYNARLGAKGGSEFLELGYLRPDIILKDLVKIGHPGILPDHKLYFHQQLR